MHQRSCLVLVDLQNEFLSPSGNFPIPDPSRLVANNLLLAEKFRAAGRPVFWIRAEYQGDHGLETRPASSPASPFNVLSGTHTGRTPCCEKDSLGARFPEEVASIIAAHPESNIIITKTWYSAFKETTLQIALEERGVEQIYVGGLLSNICVLSTATHARSLGLDVWVIEDCLGWRRIQSHERAMQSMRDLGVKVIAAVAEVEFKAQREPTARPPRPRLYYVNGSIPSWRVLMVLHEKVS